MTQQSSYLYVHLIFLSQKYQIHPKKSPSRIKTETFSRTIDLTSSLSDFSQLILTPPPPPTWVEHVAHESNTDYVNRL